MYLNMENTKHPHADLINAWANGAKIQWKSQSGWTDWDHNYSPAWYIDHEYRIKPELDDSKSIELDGIPLTDEEIHAIREVRKSMKCNEVLMKNPIAATDGEIALIVALRNSPSAMFINGDDNNPVIAALKQIKFEYELRKSFK